MLTLPKWSIGNSEGKRPPMTYALSVVVDVGILFLLWSLSTLTLEIRNGKQRKAQVLAHLHHA